MIQNLLTKVASEGRRFSQARKVVSSLDALGLATVYRKSDRAIGVKSKLLNRRVWVRPRSSDWAVVMKVLSSKEYSFESGNNHPAFIVDAGANIGIATLYFAWKYPQARIAAIEPEPSNLELLRRNCEDLPAVRIIPAALWSGHSQLFISDPAAEKWTFSVAENRTSGTAVQSVTIGDVLRESGFSHIDILKLDIEGAERELFRKGWQEWLPKVRMIVIELHDRFVPGCSQSFYSAILSRSFRQEVNGENIFIWFNGV